ncbi:MAG: prenyltransferase/squalene oxidase repeat-containing protein [Planctomycetota bacterium]
MRRALPRRPFTTAALAAASLALVVGGLGLNPSHAEEPDAPLPAVGPVPADTAEVITDRSGAATADLIRSRVAPTPNAAAERGQAAGQDPTPGQIAAARTQAIDWLLAHQNNDGGWGQGEESRHMQRGDAEQAMRDPSNVGDTAASLLALMRVGDPHLDPAFDARARMTQDRVQLHQASRAALHYLLTAVERHESNDLYITDLRGTRLQSKLGPYVDTFLTAVTLTDTLDHAPSDEQRERITAALERIVDKIEANQQANGGFGGGGWANALSVSLSNRALNDASRLGIEVDETVLGRSQQAAAGSDTVVGDRFAARGDAAGIELYAAAKAVSGTAANDVALRESVVIAAPALRQVADQADLVADELERDGEAARAEEIRQASRELVIVTEGEALDGDIAGRQAAAAGELKATLFDSDDGRRRYARVAGPDAAPASAVAESLDSFGIVNSRFNDNAQALAKTRGVVLQRLGDQQFVAGFGSDGGEEYLSYMKIGEGLAGDEDAQEAFAHFVKAMKGNLTRVQNQDGSWTGHHCITGRNFCTATALMVMTLDEWAPEKG